MTLTEWKYRQRGLNKPVLRVLLNYCCDHAHNGDLALFHSFSRIAEACELARRSVVWGMGKLCEPGGPLSLITEPSERSEILSRANGKHNPRVNVYRLNYKCGPVDSAATAPSDGAATAPSQKANGARAAPTNHPHSAAAAPLDGARAAPSMVQNLHVDGAATAPELLNELRESELRGVRPGTDDVRATLAGAPVAAPPMERPKAPTLGAPAGSVPANAIKIPGSDPDPFGEWLDRGAPEADAPVMHCDVEAPQVLTEDDPPRTAGDARHMARQAGVVVHAIGQHLRNFAIPHGPQAGVANDAAVVPFQAQDADRSAEAQIAAILAASTPEQIAKAQAAFVARGGVPA